MKEIQQLRRIAVRLGVSGTVIPIAETRLYKGGYGFVVLQCYVPITQNRSPNTSPLCTVFRTTVDKFGNRKQFNKDIYNMLYVDDAEIENSKYMIFEYPLPKAFTDTVGDLEMVFTYSEINGDDKAAVRLASGIYRVNVGDSDVSSGDTVDPVGGELARLNDITVKVEQLEDSVDALLQPPDNTDANKVGTPNVSLTEDGRLKFDELKGEKGDMGELTVGTVKQVGYNEPLKIENSGTASDAVLDFEIPQGKPAFVKVGKVVTLPPESDAQVVNIGTENDPVFDFYLPEGVGFRISKTYASVEAMNAGFATDDVPLYGFVVIDTGNVEDADNAKLYMKASTKYEYLTDLSGAQGIKGDTGNTGVGIQSIAFKEINANGGYVYTITLTNGNTYDFIAPKGAKGDAGDSASIDELEGIFVKNSGGGSLEGSYRLVGKLTVGETIDAGHVWTNKFSLKSGNAENVARLQYDGAFIQSSAPFHIPSLDANTVTGRNGVYDGIYRVYSSGNPPPVATQSKNGLMESADKTKLDGLQKVTYSLNGTTLTITES